jgi:hypothetical protein
VGTGSGAFPLLKLQMKLQVLQPSVPGQTVSYTLLRIAGKILVGNDTEEFARFEAGPLAEISNSQSYDRQLHLTAQVTPRQIKHIEDVRDGKDPFFAVQVKGLVLIQPGNEFEALQEITLQLSVPRSHWIDRALNVWKLSDLRLLEINFPQNGPKEMAVARERLGNAEQLYRIGDYSHVLTELRSAFDAIAKGHSGEVSKGAWEKFLVNTHPSVRTELLDAFIKFRDFLHLGPHEPMPTAQAPIVISRHDARFALIVAHAIFEYFSGENWPGI